MLGLDKAVPMWDLTLVPRETKIRIPEALHTVLMDEAERRGVSLNALANIVLTEWVDSIARLRDALDEARKAGGDGS